MSSNQSGLENLNQQDALVGYCHQCDRQVEIDRESFTCKQCNGGFIELFDLDNQNRRQEQQGQNANIRIEQAMPMPNLLPLLLNQLINPNMMANTRQIPSQNQPELQQQQQQQQHLQQQHLQQHLQQHNIRHGPTRLQFIVPTNLAETGQEQFDLYGIINNVINDLLDPTRRPMSGQNIHIQGPPIRMFQLHGDVRDYAWGAGGLDTIITQLLNQLENTGPPPASQDQLRNLPQIKITQQEVDKNAQCAICMEEFNLDDIAKKLPCKHLFHEPCVVEWLKLHGTCPVCRKNLNGEDTSQREYISRPPTQTTTNTNTTTTTSNSSNSTNSTNTQNNQNNQNNNNNNQNNSSSYYEPEFD